MAILNNPQASASPPTRAAMCRRTLRGGLIAPALALLSVTFAANADSPTSVIQMLDVDLVERASVGTRNDCWENAPMDAEVACAPPWPEHGSLTAKITLPGESDIDTVVKYNSMDLTATAGTDYVALDGSLTIKAGEREGSISIALIDDLLEEGNEEFVVAVTGENVNLEHTHIHVTIIDEESIKVEVYDSSEDEGHPEGMLVVATLSDYVFWPVRMRLAPTAGTAGPSDYQDGVEIRQIIPGPFRFRSFHFRHRLVDDSLDEPDESYTFTISGNEFLSTDADSGTMTIIDDDDPPSLSMNSPSGLEDSVGKLTFVAQLSGPSSEEVTVDWQTADGTATAGSDYTSGSGTLTFSPGDERKTIEVTVTSDNMHEDDETLTLELTDPVNATVPDTDAVGTIENDDPELSIADAAASEADGKLSFLVKADGLKKQNQTVTVDYATADDTATAGSDYDSDTGTLTFTSTATERTITVTVLDDDVDEPDEKLAVNLTNPMNASIGDASAEGKILDNDVASAGIALKATPARVLEDAGATVVEVTATLDAGTRSEATTVAVTVSGSGNADAVDFQNVPSFTITIAAGDKSGSGTFTLTPEDDNVDESDETLSVTGTSVLTVTGTEVELADDDSTSSSISLTAEPPRVLEGDGATRVRVTATLDGGARTGATTVTVTVSGSGNEDAVDFADVADFTITIAAGARSGTGNFTLTPEDDNVDESDETLDIGGSSALPVTADTVALADDDQPSAAILLSASPGRIAEDGGGSPVQVTARLDASARTVATTVSVSVAGSGRPDAVDYAASATAFDITIAAGATAGTGMFTVTPVDDEVDERDEVLDIAGTSDLPVTPASVTLADDDQTSTEIVLSAAPSTVSEGAGATPVEVTATLDAGVRTQATTVTVTVSGSGNADAVDFADVADFTITIAAGARSGTGSFTLTPEDDNVDESDETLTVSGSSDLSVTEHTMRLADDDEPSAAILLSASPARIAEDGGVAPIQVTATLDASARAVATTVSVSVAGSGRPDAVDYAASATAFDITIAAGATAGTGTFTVTPEDDEVDERDEVLDIAGASDLPVTPASVTLADDDQTSTEIVLSAAPSTVSEGAGATPVEVTATLDAGARTASTTVTVEVTGSGDPDAVGFASVQDFTIMIASGATSGRATFTLTPEDDNVAESGETLTVDGSSDLPVTQTTVTLTDDDVASSGIVLSASPSLVSEDGGAVPVRVTASLNGAARQAATTVTVSVAGSGNPRAVDFQAVEDFEITIAPNAASGTGTFTLTPVDDGAAEADETLTLSGASDLPVTSTTVTLADDDDASTRILLSAVPGLVSEGDGPTPVTVTATLDRALRQQATTVTVTVTGGGDAGAADFAAVADFPITIPANAASGEGTFTLTPVDDATAEADETLTLSGASDLPVTPATVTLADDEDPSTRILLSASPGRVSEGDGPTAVTVTATLDRALRQQATAVTVTVSGSGAAGAADFAAVADFAITIPANAASGVGTFTLTPEDDATAEADETLTLSGASDLPVTPATVTLADDEDPSTRILLSAAPGRVSEGDGATPVTVTATLDRALRQQATTVTVTVTGGGDAGAADFAAVADFSITIPANAASGEGTFTLTPEDDAMVEADETLTVSGASDLPVTPTAVTLADDDEVSTRILLFLTVDPPRASEGDGEILVTVTAEVDRGVRPDETRIRVAVSGSGDPDAVDFAAVSDFEIVIPANARNGTGTFTVVPEDDVIPEADEVLTISGVSDLPVSPAILELLDDDEASGRILLSADPARVSEGGGPVAVTVTASLDRGVRQSATTVTVSVSGGGDRDAVDFAAVSDFEIVIPANTPKGTGTFTVVPEDDLIAEADEVVTISGVSDLPVRPATLELLDDDEASGRIVLSADPGRVSEGGGPVAVTVTASLDRGLRQEATTVTVSVSGGGDPDAVDFAAVADFAITIEANAPSGTGTFTLTPEDDAVDEADETLALTGESDLPVTPATLELLDDDEASGRILLSADPARVSEGGGPVAVTVTASLDRGLRQEATTVTVSVTGSGNPDAVDFAAVADFAITIEANAPSGTGTFTLTPEDDAEDEADETLALTGESDLPVTPASVVLADDDEMASRVLSIADAEASEGAGEVRFAVTLDGPSAAEVTVGYATADPAGSLDPVAEAGIDYDSAAGTLTFAPGEVSRTIRVPIIDDDLDEPDETFALVLSDPRGASLGRGSALGTIRDDDEPPALSIAGDTGREDVGELVFSVTLTARALTEVTVNYATMDDTAVAGDDYVPVEGTLTFAPGEVSQTIRVPIVDDDLDEPDETFALVLADLRGATLGRGSARGTILDDDEPPALSVADAAGDEDAGALEFEVTLSVPSGIEVSASYATKDGTATAGGDYEAATGTLSFAPGEVSRTIRVAILDDALHEADEETFELTLARLVNATADDVSATGTIRDNDLAPPAVAGDLPAALLCVGGAPYELDLADYFDGKELRFSAVSSTPLVATATLAGSRLTVAPASEGESSVTVTATNEAGSASGLIGVRVVADPAELEAVESVLASIGRAVLTGVTDSVSARFDPRIGFGEQGASTDVQRGRTQIVPGASGVLGSQWPGPPMRGTGSGGRDGRGLLLEPQVAGDDWFETMNRTHRRDMVPFSFSLDSAQSGSTGPAWGVWGRADAHRFESGIDGSSHDGTLTAVHLGADARVGDWLAGVSVARSAAQADYRFERSVDACGGGGAGEGMVEAGLTSVHPYVGRQVGRGQVWATVGAGGGEVSVERCETGHRNETDLSMRLGALGGRHPFAGGERIEISVVEEIGVLDLTTGEALGPVGDRSVTVGQARLGLEASGVVPAGCECSLSSFVRAFARGDWGDGATGTGLELAAGVRFRNLPRRLGIDAGVRALAAHSAADASEHSANLTFSILPKADGTGWRASLAWRQGAGDSRLDALGGISPWTAPSASLPGVERRWVAESRLGYGIRLQRGFATPFVELDAGHSRRGARFGVRHEFGDRARGLAVEWGIEQHRFFAGVENRIVVEALGRF